MKYIIIQGSARSDGNTHTMVNILAAHLNAEVIDIKKLNIHSYSYQHEHITDDFIPTMRKLVEFDTIIFVTPVYWYSMSGIMKNFMDRITDCLKVEKDTGRKLRGKNMAVVSCGSEREEVEGFFHPFRLSAAYLGMNYVGDVHTWINGTFETEVKERLDVFAHYILKRSVI